MPVKLLLNPPAFGCALVVRNRTQLGDLHPEDDSLLPENAAEKRKSEFALGRAAARQALAELGWSEPPPILRGAGREPLWPSGVVGSITHCGDWAIAAVAKCEDVKTLGIDLEDVNRVPHKEIATLVSSESERRWIFGGDDGQVRLAMLFSAKESIYKAFFPLAHRFLDFHDVELTWLPERDIFLGRLCTRLSSELCDGYSIEAGCQLQENFVFTHAFLASGESS